MSTSEEKSKDDVSKKKSVSDLFEDWSRPIGLVLLGIFGYIEYGLEKEVSQIYIMIAGALLVGDKISQVLKK